MEHEGDPSYVYIAEGWEKALDLGMQTLDVLREIFPLRTWDLTETGSLAIDKAMDHFKEGILALHRAGRHVLGTEHYDNFMQDRSERQVGQVIERGDT